jgi:hypothetical protein
VAGWLAAFLPFPLFARALNSTVVPDCGSALCGCSSCPLCGEIDTGGGQLERQGSAFDSCMLCVLEIPPSGKKQREFTRLKERNSMGTPGFRKKE